MNVDKWARCGQFLLINGPDAVIVLYWVSDGSCDCFIIQVGFWIELPVQIMDPSKWDIMVWYRVTRYPQAFCGLMGDQRTLGFWGVAAWYQSIGMRLSRALWTWV